MLEKLENIGRGSCREARAEMEMAEQGRAERNGERVVRRGIEREREYCIYSRVRRAIEVWEKEDQE